MTQPVGPSGYTSPLPEELQARTRDGAFDGLDAASTVMSARGRADSTEDPWARHSALKADLFQAQLFLQAYSSERPEPDSLEGNLAYINTIANLAFVVGRLKEQVADAEPGVLRDIARSVSNVAQKAASDAAAGAKNAVSQTPAALRTAGRVVSKAVTDTVVEQADSLVQSLVDVGRGLEQDAVEVAEGLEQDADEVAERIEFVVDTTDAVIDYTVAWWNEM